MAERALPFDDQDVGLLGFVGLDDRGLQGLLEDCFEQGVLVAPGLSCGEAYADWIRLSFTAVPPDAVIEAARRLASVLGRA